MPVGATDTAKKWNGKASQGRQAARCAPAMDKQTDLLLRYVAATSPFRGPEHKPPQTHAGGPQAACPNCDASFISTEGRTADENAQRHRTAMHQPAAAVDPGRWAGRRTPRWFKVYQAIKRDLDENRWKPGDALPILALCREHDITQPLLSRVIRLLVGEWRLEYQGTGTRRRTLVCHDEPQEA
jgi:hypothetical protein